MKTKIFAGLLGIMSFAFALNSAAASQIPAGYVLVPAEAFFTENVNLAAPTKAEVSANKSSLRANDEIGFVGKSYSTITATLRDETGSPIAGRKVNLVSSRATDTVQALQIDTSTNGEAIFRILANEEGVSSFTAVAENQAVSERPRIVFLQKTEGIGGNLLGANIAADVITATATNQIEAEFPEQVTIDAPTDLVVEIEDSEGNLAEDFTGTISFTSSDELAILPRDYTFTGLDRGSHTFANAVTFITAGSQIIYISGDTDIPPQQFSVEVLGSTEDLEPPIITSPSNGELLNETVSFLGFAEASSNLAVFMNEQLFAEGESDAAGRFLIDVDLPDGQHEITVAILGLDGSARATSEAVEIEVDQTPPTVESTLLDPGNKVTTGTLVKIGVKSESELINVQLRVGEDFFELEETEMGTYFKEFTAPASGTYFLDLELTDVAGNIGSYPEVTSLLVEPRITIQEIETASKNEQVDLVWEPPANHAEIKNYEIFYGTDEENLSQKFTTTDNRTAWFIDRLNNNTVYFFQIVSLDASGAQNGGSEIASATPTPPPPPTITATGCDGKIILEWRSCENPAATNYRLDYGIESENYVESRMLPDGAARNEWEVRDLINGVEYFFALRGVDDFGKVVANLSGEASAIPQAGKTCPGSEEETIQLWQREDADGNLILVWNSVSGATSYRIYAGTQPDLFDLPTAEVSSTSFRPEGLLANEDYYFAVSAIYLNSHEAATLSNITKIEVGPAEILLISFGIALTGSWLIRRRFARS